MRAPSSGYVTDVALQPGQVLGVLPLPVMSFVNSEKYVMVANFYQVVLGNIRAGDEAEIALDGVPGHTLAAKVKGLRLANPKGQVTPSGTIVDPSLQAHGRFFVEFTLDDDNGLALPAGEAGAATVHTQYGRACVPVRKAFFRWYTWVNFIITEMDIRGKRE